MTSWRLARWTRWACWGLAPLLVSTAWAQVMLLPPELAAKLTAVNQRPLTLDPAGDPVRFTAASGSESWEEAAPPSIIDADRDGTNDYIVMLLVDEKYGRRALIAREWGDSAASFGRTLFYVILEESDEVAEWAGTPLLPLPAPPKP